MTLDASIIITTYNVERYIMRAVESALNQRNVAAEIIIVDDCSRDGTWAIISALNDSRIRVFQMETNGGPGAARNKGFAEARGDWIVVLDGDDAMEPERLACCITRARQAQADMVVDNLTICREEDGKEFLMFPNEPFSKLAQLDLATFIRDKLTPGGYPLGYLKPIFSAAFLRQHHLHYDTQLRIGEDYLIVAEALAQQAHCVVEPVAGYRYTVRAGSISHRLTLDNILQIEQAHEAFGARFALSGEAAHAQRQRSVLLKRMRAYAQLVAAIKARSARGALQAITISPMAISSLWQPVWKRLKAALI